MSRRLRSGLPRLYADHRSRKARWYGEEYRRLQAKANGQGENLTIAAADLWASWKEGVLEKDLLERRRATGKGRRPSALDLSRLDRQVGRLLTKYRKVRRELTERAHGNGRPGSVPSSDEVLERLRAVPPLAGRDGE